MIYLTIIIIVRIAVIGVYPHPLHRKPVGDVKPGVAAASGVTVVGNILVVVEIISRVND